MSRIVCSRVACLRLPWFPIDALRRAGLVGRDSASALVAGRGSHARLVACSPAARAAGIRPGMRPGRARALASSVDLVSHDERVEATLCAASDDLARALAPVAPRLLVVEPGVLWLEPAARTASGERAFGHEVVAAATAAEIPGGRVGIADGPVAAAAATRLRGHPVHRVEVGGDRSFLATLPVHALPIGDALCDLLHALGVRGVSTLQGMDPGELEARFGAPGRRAWRLACGEDPRRPVTPRPGVDQRVEVPLLEPCRTEEPLLFVVRGAVGRVVAGLAARGLAIARVAVTLDRERGEPIVIELTPSRPASDPALLFQLVRARMRQQLAEAVAAEHAPGVVGVVVEAVRTTPAGPRQGDLFSARWSDPAAAEVALARIEGRLGEGAVVTAQARDEHRPEAAGAWRTVHEGADVDPQDPLVLTRRPRLAACLRLLEQPAPARAAEQGELHIPGVAGSHRVQVSSWHGPERLSGHWWGDAYDRDYYWAAATDGRMFWVYRDRQAGAWFVHGWLD